MKFLLWFTPMLIGSALGYTGTPTEQWGAILWAIGGFIAGLFFQRWAEEAKRERDAWKREPVV